MNNSENRKSFQKLPINENPHFITDASEIYLALRCKYPNNDVVHLDNILNSLCYSLIILMNENVCKSNQKPFIQLVYKILNDNIIYE